MENSIYLNAEFSMLHHSYLMQQNLSLLANRFKSSSELTGSSSRGRACEPLKPLLKFLLGLVVFIAFADMSLAQNTGWQVSGKITDAATKEPVGYATVVAVGLNTGARSEEDGSFVVKAKTRITKLSFSCVGYKTIEETIVFKDGEKAVLNVELEPQSEMLKEVVIKPKRYRNKNNPAVALIELVVKNRDKNRVENFSSFQEEQYEKLLMGMSNISDKFKNRRMMRSWKFALDNVDTTKLKTGGVIPTYLQEAVQDFYSKTNPKQQKTWIKATQKVEFPLLDNEGVEKYIRYMYQDVNIYDNFVVLLTDHFLSPIANSAPLFYRYYPADTIVQNGSKIVRLQFFPRNKTDMLLQGDLYVALDSTYPVTKIVFSVNPMINLNWVRELEVEQTFQKLPESGKWVLDEETISFDFGLTQKGAGMYGERYVSHQNPKLGLPLHDSLFQKMYEPRSLRQNANTKDTTFWRKARHAELTASELATYKNIDSLQNTALFKRIKTTIQIAIVGHYEPTPGIEIGRINTFYAFNPVEGTRVRFGGRTNPSLFKKVNFEGFAAYGFRDERWKYGLAANISLSKRNYNVFPYNMLRINYQQDVMIPGVIPIGTFIQTNIGTSFTRGQNDRFLFMKKFLLQYEKEFYNKFSFQVGFEHKELAPLGSLTFDPTDDVLQRGAPVVTANPFVQVRFAPGEEFYQTKNGWRQRVRFNLITQLRYSRGVSGILGSQYDYNEVTAVMYKFSNLPPIGYNYFYVEAGGVFGKVPYPLLTLHRANQTFGYRFLSYNLMNFMEFVSDRYVAAFMEHSFYGFFTNKIPVIRRLKLREFFTLKVLYGQISKVNTPNAGSGLYELPTNADGTPLTYSLEAKPYIEANIGIGNIFKVIRIDYIRRFTYLDHPFVSRSGIRMAAKLSF